MVNPIDIIILAAGDIRNKFSYIKNNCSSPALIPVNTRPLAYYVLQHYISSFKSNANIYMVIDDYELNNIKRELNQILKCSNVILVPIEPTQGVNDSLKIALNNISIAGDVIVNIVTTIPTKTPSINEVIIDSDTSKNYEWSIVKMNDGDKVKIIPKSDETKQEGHAFTGLFCVRANQLLEGLHSTGTSNDLSAIVQAIKVKSDLNFITTDWIDCGHEVNFPKAKTKLINSRSFNKISVTEDNKLIKHSEHSEKLKNEASFITSLPDELSKYFPVVFQAEYDSHNQYYYKMSYHGYPNMAELMLYWEVLPSRWEQIFRQFQKVLGHFSSFKSSFSHNDYVNFYFEKTDRRIEEFSLSFSHTNKQSWLTDNVIFNNTNCLPYHELKQKILDRIISLYKPDDICIMHGDFCFNNILYEIPTNQLLLIDPRGSFGNEKSIYGDIKYDLAKLIHSSVFGYDLLANDLFEFNETSKNQFELKLNWRPNRSLLGKLSEELILNFNFDLSDIEFITGLLFISMPPLHPESPVRQKVMYLYGLSLLNKTLD